MEFVNKCRIMDAFVDNRLRDSPIGGIKEMNMIDVRESAMKVYHYTTSRHSTDWGMNIDQWDWVPGVGVNSILHFFESGGTKSAIDFLVNWVKLNKGKSEKLNVINSMAPFAIYPFLFEFTNDKFYLDEARRIGEWILHDAPRTREGALEHTVTEKASFPEQVWADTIFMAVLFLARLARITNDRTIAEEALKQTELHLRLLQDQETGVLFHGWNSAARNHMSAARWTRANAWIAVGVPEIVNEVSSIIDIPTEIQDRYKQMMNGLINFQGEKGLWHTVMDRHDFYEETSGSAGIACGILKAVRYGLLDPTYIHSAAKTVAGILEKIEEDGRVTGVSGGTPIMPTIEHYNMIPTIPTLYGQGLVLMMLSEWLMKGNDTSVFVGEKRK